MLFHHIVVLALVQGLTEFLPISSSAHLILPAQVLGWPDQGLAFDLAVHLGTLGAVLVYMRKELWRMSLASLAVVKTHELDKDAKLTMMLVLATLPAVIIGYVVKDLVEAHLRSILVIALASIVFGILLAWVDKHQERKASLRKQMNDMTWTSALFIGFAQVLAFIPGTSRSGITITAALTLGFARQDALRFSFLLSIPIILAGSLLSALDLFQQGAPADVWRQILSGMLIAGVSAFACIHLFITWVDRLGMLPFVIYRVLLGIALLLLYFQL